MNDTIFSLQRPLYPRIPLLRSSVVKPCRLSSTSSVISSLSTPVPTQRQQRGKRSDDDLPISEPDYSSSPFWREAPRSDEDEEEISADEEDTEDFDKSNSDYILSLSEPPSSRRPGSQQNVRSDQLRIQIIQPDSMMTSDIILPRSPPSSQLVSPGGLGTSNQRTGNPLHGGVAELLRDLEDEDHNNQSREKLEPSLKGSSPSSINSVESKGTGLDLLTGYFDEEESSDTSTEAMRLLSDSLMKTD